MYCVYMATFRVKVRWSGFSGAPGYNIFHFGDGGGGTTRDPQAAVNAVRTFYTAFGMYIPNTVSLTIDSAVEVIDTPTGKLTDILTITPGNPIVGSSTATFAAPAGVVVHWLSGGIRNGRRMRGRTFLVPMVTTVFQNDGTIATAVLSTFQSAADALVADSASELLVYGRPSTKLGPGQVTEVSAARVPDKVCVLRSRRD